MQEMGVRLRYSLKAMNAVFRIGKSTNNNLHGNSKRGAADSGANRPARFKEGQVAKVSVPIEMADSQEQVFQITEGGTVMLQPDAISTYKWEAWIREILEAPPPHP